MSTPGGDDLADAVVTALVGRQPSCGRTTVVGIDGPSGSGKTTLADTVAARTGATVLHLEDLYRGWRGLEAAPPAAADILAAIAIDEIGRAPTWDWADETEGPDLVVPPAPLVVVEGVGAGARVVAPFLSLLVWLDGPENTRRARALFRDGDTYEPWWTVWAEQERTHFAREGTRSRADLVAELA